MNKERYFWIFALVLAVLLTGSFVFFKDLYEPRLSPSGCDQLSADAQICIGDEGEVYRPSSVMATVFSAVAIALMLLSGILGYRATVRRQRHG